MRDDTCLKQYLKWIRDPRVTKYLETRFKPVKTTEQLKHWIRRINESEDSLIFGLYHRNTMTHIGNIKISNIDNNHRKCEIGFLIGDINYQKQGFCKEALGAVIKLLALDFKIRKIIAGCYSVNIGSIATLNSLKFELEGVLKDCWRFNDVYVDGLIYSKTIY